MALPLQRSARWLFIGDSITDCGRRDCPDRIGDGYVRLVRDWLLARDAAHAPEILNQGISGNKVTDLQARWSEDVLAHRPDLVSIKIGINDVWHGLDGRGNGVSLDQFVAVYTDLLDQLKSQLPQATVVLCEPSIISPPAAEDGNEVLLPYVEAVRTLAKERQLSLVPLHRTFLDALEARPDVSWAPDGVHPASPGSMLLARTWLATLGLL